MSYDQLIAADVEKFGVSLVTIDDHVPPFAYTVGLMYADQPGPELVVFGLPDDGPALLRGMAVLSRGGQSFAAGGLYRGILDGNRPLTTRPVHPTQHEFYLGFAMGHCTGRGHIGQLRAVQVFWPDAAGKFPFEPGCDARVGALQPRLDQPLTPREVDERRGEHGTGA